MWLWKAITKRKRIVGFAFLFIILLGLVSYIAAVSNDWYWFPFNPPPPPTSFTIPMMIPPTNPNAAFPWPDLYLGISLRANGTIAEGVEVTLTTATAWIASNDYYLRLDAVQVFFQESIAWSFKNSSTPLNVVPYIGWRTAIIFQRDLTNPANGSVKSTGDVFGCQASGDLTEPALAKFMLNAPCCVLSFS